MSVDAAARLLIFEEKCSSDREREWRLVVRILDNATPTADCHSSSVARRAAHRSLLAESQALS